MGDRLEPRRPSAVATERYQCGPLHPRMRTRSKIVPTMETKMEPRQPRRFEKKANIGWLSRQRRWPVLLIERLTYDAPWLNPMRRKRSSSFADKCVTKHELANERYAAVIVPVCQRGQVTRVNASLPLLKIAQRSSLPTRTGHASERFPISAENSPAF